MLTQPLSIKLSDLTGICSSKLSRGYHQGILLCILCSAQLLIHLLRELRHETASYSLRASVWQPIVLQCSKQLWISNPGPSWSSSQDPWLQHSFHMHNPWVSLTSSHLPSPEDLEFWWLCDQPDGRSSAARNSIHNTSGAVEQSAPNQHSPEIARQGQFDFEDATSWKAPCSLYF